MRYRLALALHDDLAAMKLDTTEPFFAGRVWRIQYVTLRALVAVARES
jgi:hypothetical protein